MDGKQSQTADPLSRMIAARDEAEGSDSPGVPLNSMTEQEFVERYSGTADESNTSRPDGLHCVYGKCQGIPHSANPCHPGCSFTMTCVSDLEVWRRQTAERTCLISWRPLSEWERAPHLSQAMFTFPCKGDSHHWSVAVVCDPDVYVDCLSEEDRRSGLWALVPYPYPQPEMLR